jgi:Zn-finger nucleic acid-binding protein
MPDPEAPLPKVRPECPRCKAGLRQVMMDRGASLNACGACGGMFVGARAWCMFLERPDLVTAIEKRLPKRGQAPSALLPMVTCASCGSQMERGRFAASSGVVVDVCPRHGVWLDEGELGRVAEYARSPQRTIDAPEAHPVMKAVEEERMRIVAIAATIPRKAPKPLWLKLLPVVFLVIGILVRIYYVQKLANEANNGGMPLPQAGQLTRQAGEEGSNALGGR